MKKKKKKEQNNKRGKEKKKERKESTSVNNIYEHQIFSQKILKSIEDSNLKFAESANA